MRLPDGTSHASKLHSHNLFASGSAIGLLASIRAILDLRCISRLIFKSTTLRGCVTWSKCTDFVTVQQEIRCWTFMLLSPSHHRPEWPTYRCQKYAEFQGTVSLHLRKEFGFHDYWNSAIVSQSLVNGHHHSVEDSW